MIEAFVLWNEPNNLSHWNFHLDPGWRGYAELVKLGSEAIRGVNPAVPVVLGGVSSCDCDFLRNMAAQGVMDHVDAVGVHGFPLDWNHWQIDDWPAKVAEAYDVSGKPVWVLEVGASSFGAEEVQEFGLRRTLELLSGRVERIHWYSLFDLPPTWPAETRHKEAEGSSYYRHYYLGLVKDDGRPKLAEGCFPSDGSVGICQWFHFEDPRLDDAVRWMKERGVRYLRTGLSWADAYRPNATAWFDRMMAALEPFDVALTLCFTPAHLGMEEHHTSPPRDNAQFAEFARWAAERYGPASSSTSAADEQKRLAIL
ncbi:glycosyl hydrolase [Occallatibacter riparius]|uniref:Glycosyl hydrolase n=1 Tax=Occallatibacter riparius TaxID=1002689 RepID=A0A9J7BZ95_9BACT|nr:glycosyl hydrolase [Occallatibacter riparius]UWZ86942.1 glycosyl hydrolase [Occallatibacter riparius]